MPGTNPANILNKSIAGRYRPVSYPDGPITARYRFIKNAYWDDTGYKKKNATCMLSRHLVISNKVRMVIGIW